MGLVSRPFVSLRFNDFSNIQVLFFEYLPSLSSVRVVYTCFLGKNMVICNMLLYHCNFLIQFVSFNVVFLILCEFVSSLCGKEYSVSATVAQTSSVQ